MDKDTIISKTRNFVYEKLKNEGSGHDFFHIERVYNLSLKLAKEENADEFIVSLTALLHDIGDHKFTKDNLTDTSLTEEFLKSLSLPKEDIEKITAIINTMSFKGGVTDSFQQTIEGKVVQDADRLDAIGAIGIARTFTYGGYKNRILYDPKVSPKEHKTLESLNEDNTTINHFYEKLLKLKNLMNTESAKKIALKRHKFMENFLDEFYDEWNYK